MLILQRWHGSFSTGPDVNVETHLCLDTSNLLCELEKSPGGERLFVHEQRHFPEIGMPIFQITALIFL